MDINVAFETTFKLIFGECNVKLDDLAEYLLKYHPLARKQKSSISGKDIVLAPTASDMHGRFISQDEIDFGKKFEPLSVDEVKDLDSIVEAIQDRVYYTGNKIFGNCNFVDEVDNCYDSNHVYKSHNVVSAKYVAYSTFVRHESEYAFGSNWFLRSKYVIRISCADNLTRCFEAHDCTASSDLFFCFNCMGSSNLMFSFNQRSKRNCIGNLELPKDKYLALREKLVAESREYIEKNKTFYSIFDMPAISKQMQNELKARRIRIAKSEEENLKTIEDSFEATCRVIFGSDIGSLNENREFLCERIKKVEKVKTAFGKETTYFPIYMLEQVPKDRIVDVDENEEAAKLKMEINGKDGLESIINKVSNIALYGVNMLEGNSTNVTNCALVYHAVNCYSIGDATLSKNCAYCSLALSSESVFGCYRITYSKFSIRCENSVNLTACFEMDSCTNCANSMFCHNCENLDHCMFCFNTKSKRYAIGNVEVGREKYLEIRKRVLGGIVRQMKKDKKLGIDIYNLGERRD